MKRMVIGLLAAFALVIGTGLSANAGWDGDTEDDTAIIDGTTGNNHDQSTGVSDDPVYRVPGPWTDYTYAPTCGRNGPDGAGDALCMAAISPCPKGEIRYWVYTRQMGADDKPVDGKAGEWDQQGVQCRGADDPPEGGPVQITEAMIFDQAKQAAPKTEVHSEPGTKSYVNVPTNFYAEDEDTTVNVTVLGQSIPLTFAPEAFSWNFGDGSTGSGAGIKDAKVGAPGAVEHDYRRSGDVGITLSRSFNVTANLPNGQTLTLPTPVRNESAPYGLEIGEIQSVVTTVR